MVAHFPFLRPRQKNAAGEGNRSSVSRENRLISHMPASGSAGQVIRKWGNFYWHFTRKASSHQHQRSTVPKTIKDDAIDALKRRIVFSGKLGMFRQNKNCALMNRPLFNDGYLNETRCGSHLLQVWSTNEWNFKMYFCTLFFIFGQKKN